MTLDVQRASRAAGVPADAQLRRWAHEALSRPAAVTLRVVGAREGRALNLRYRERDYATNVLTFVYEPLADALCGDLVLCAPVISREAREQGKPVEAHYAHLVVHGLLHLQGHDHETAAEARRMEARERAILGRMGYPDPYVLPACAPRRH